MFKLNGFRSLNGWFFGLIDSLLILGGIFLGDYLRFMQIPVSIYHQELFVFKAMLVVLVVQVCFYYFELYDSKGFRRKVRIATLLTGALTVSAIILTILYYFIPFLALGSGLFTISLTLIWIFTFLWRLLYSHALKLFMLKERILIIGTGDLAKKIKSEILDNGYEGFEIVGFIDEKRGDIGKGV